MAKLFLALVLFATVLAYCSAGSSGRRIRVHRPISYCARKRDGDYRHFGTFDCRHYIECKNHRAFSRRCRHGGYFDADKRRCVDSCPTGPHGILDCYDRPDGHWQHCCYCDLYASCAARGWFFHRRCEPGGTVWDDKEHKCLGKSCTCKREHRYYPLNTMVKPW